ncbi:MAG: hypothetical protein HOY79_45270 [Streptomyces sp.]|nr:hypothetical protein [Streptomyces sp.]
MKQHRSIKRKVWSALSGLAVTASVLTAATLTGQTAASAAPLAKGTSGVEPTSVYTEFTDWLLYSSTPQEGWTVSHTGAQNVDWYFTNVHDLAPTGSEGIFAILAGTGHSLSDGIPGVDASLVSPAVDLTGQDSPTVEFDSRAVANNSDELYAASESVEVSLNGGQSWSTAWQAEPGYSNQHVTLPIPQAAGHSGVLVRFHLTGWASVVGSWAIDNVFIGTK